MQNFWNTELLCDQWNQGKQYEYQHQDSLQNIKLSEIPCRLKNNLGYLEKLKLKCILIYLFEILITFFKKIFIF